MTEFIAPWHPGKSLAFLQKKKVILKYKNNHPSIERAIEIIAGYFDNYIIKQDLLATQEQYDTVKGKQTNHLIFHLFSIGIFSM